MEIIARAPDRVNAFISALLEIARNYSLRDENFFFAALRAYQELHMNYFEDIEQAADVFVKEHRLPDNGGVPADLLADLLCTEFGYKIDGKGLDPYPELNSLRSVFHPRKRKGFPSKSVFRGQICLAKDLRPWLLPILPRICMD